MELYFPKHRSYKFSINSKEDSNKSNNIAINLISSNFHIINIVINNTYKDRTNRANSMNNIQR